MARTVGWFGLLMIAMTLAMAVGGRWAWPLVETYRMAPRVPFEALPALPDGAYDRPDMWIARPDLAHDPAQFLPPGILHRRRGSAFVFFVHPTTFMGRNHWNAPIDHADSRMRADVATRSMASVFNDEAATWVPRYRQAALGTLLVDRPESARALALAQADVRAGFAVFVRHLPPGAPIVLAGEGQGALIALRLLRDGVRGTALAPRVIAVYLGGWPVSPRHDVPDTGMVACARPGQTGCIMAWMTFADPPDPRAIETMASHVRALDGSFADDRPLCTNPLTGGLGPNAPDSANLGSLTTGDELRRPALVLPSKGACCDPAKGVLVMSGPTRLGDLIRPGNDYTFYDFALFWRNLRADVAAREAAWWQEHHAS